MKVNRQGHVTYFGLFEIINLELDTKIPSLWPSGIGSRLGRNRLRVRFLAVSDIYPMFIEPTITWVPLGFTGYTWLDTKIMLKKEIKSVSCMQPKIRKVI